MEYTILLLLLVPFTYCDTLLQKENTSNPNLSVRGIINTYDQRLMPNRVRENIRIRFYRKTFTDFTVLNLTDLQTLFFEETFNPNYTTIIYVPGLYQDMIDPASNVLCTSYLDKMNYNVLQLDYTAYSKEFVFFAYLATSAIGKVTAKALRKLKSAEINDNNIQCIGHSVGAHICGAISKHMKPKMKLVVGLDPAGPLFKVLPHLEKGKADYVIALHTDAGYLGIDLTSADVDYVINEGVRTQPGCPLWEDPFSLTEGDLCSHQRSIYYWAEIIQNPDTFLAVPCKHIRRFKMRLCNEYNVTQISPDARVYGKYYFHTHFQSPFGLTEKGIVNLSVPIDEDNNNE